MRAPTQTRTYTRLHAVIFNNQQAKCDLVSVIHTWETVLRKVRLYVFNETW